MARAGGVPSPRGARKDVPTFREVFEKVIERRVVGWRNPRTEQKWRRYYRDMVEPVIGDKRVDLVTREDIETIVMPHWRGRGSLGYVVRQHLASVLALAMFHGYRLDNPARDIKEVVPRDVKSVVAHHPSLPHREIREAMRRMQASPNDLAVKLALLFTVLCAARVGEVAGAQWWEMDLEERVWTRPAERMKANVEHRVPLPEQAMAVLERMPALDRSDAHVFVLPAGRQVTPHDFTKVLRPLKLVDRKKQPIVVHGFRSTFRTWAMDVELASREGCEIALAHRDSETARTYGSDHTDMLDYRRGLMQKWADYVVPRSLS